MVNAIQGIGDDMEEREMVENVLRSLPMICNPNIYALEDRENLDKLAMEELYGILIAYEMRIEQDNSQKKEATFKTSDKSKAKIQLGNSDDEEALLVKNIKRGTGKYKGKLPLICFNCGEIGQYASKFPNHKQEDNDECPKDSNKNKQKIEEKEKEDVLFHG